MMSTPVVLWTFLAVICVGRGDQLIETDKQAGAISADDSDDKISSVTSANKEFAFRLYRKMADHAASQGKNIFFSPVSVSAALAALSVGARGETHQQLFSGLGFNSFQLTQADVDQAFRTLLTNTVSHKGISQGSAVFVDNLFKPKPEFMHVLKQCYFTESINVDFTNSTESANAINRYVSGKTNGQINKLVESLDPSTVIYLLSYIVFKGNWETRFDPKQTKPDLFRVDENNEVPVQMMKLEDVVETYYDHDLVTSVLHLSLKHSYLNIIASVLHLPLKHSYSMLLLLPDHMDTLENKISPAHVSKWLKRMKPKQYKIFVPKFSTKTSYKLNGVLTEMGMGNMFGNYANLSGIAEGKKLVVSEVVHQATLDFDEAGATAAAATGVGIILESLLSVPELMFNRPFMVIITERSAKNLLFMGKIVNPNI